MCKTIRNAGRAAADSFQKEKKSKDKDKTKKKGKADKFYNTFEEKQFQQHLNELSLQYIEMKGDGNCLFRSIAHQLGKNPEEHMTFREEVLDYMLNNKDSFMMFIDVDEEDITDEVFADYIERMKSFGEWGGHPELYAAAQLYNVDIVVHQWDAPKYVINGCANAPKTLITLSYHGDCHYNSIIALDGSRETQTTQDLSDKYLESILRSVPWATKEYITIANREIAGSREMVNSTQCTRSTIDDVIDFLCSNMEALNVGAFNSADEQPLSGNEDKKDQYIDDLQKHPESSQDVNDTEWQISKPKGKKRDKIKVLSKKVLPNSR